MTIYKLCTFEEFDRFVEEYKNKFPNKWKKPVPTNLAKDLESTSLTLSKSNYFPMVTYEGEDFGFYYANCDTQEELRTSMNQAGWKEDNNLEIKGE